MTGNPGDRRQILTLIRDCSMYLVNSLAAKFAGLFLVPIYTRLFHPRDFGTLEVANNLTWMGAAVLMLGMDIAVARFFSDTESESERKRTASSALLFLTALSVAITAALLVTLRFWSPYLVTDEEYQPCLQIAIASIPLVLLGGFFLNLLKWTRCSREYVVLSILSMAISLGTAVYLVVVARIGLIGAFWASLAGNAFMTAAGAFLTRHCYGGGGSISRLRQLLTYGMPMVPAALATTAILMADRFFLAWFRPLEEVGLYAVAIRVSSLAGLLIASFQTAWGPFAFSIHRQPEARTVYARVFTYYAVVAGSLVVALSLFGRDIVRVLTSNAYLDCVPLIPLLTVAVCLHGLFYIVSIGPGISMRTWLIGKSALIGAAVCLLVNASLVPKLGAMGAAIALVTAHSAQTAVLYFTSQKYYPVNYPWAKAGWIALVCAGYVALGAMIPAAPLAASVALRCAMLATFVGLLMACRVLEDRDRAIVRDLALRAMGRLKLRATTAE